MSAIKQSLRKESALFTGLLFVGLVLVPFAVFSVGQVVFGDYGGIGYADFFATLSEKVRYFDGVAWFLILSPYIGWQCLRLLAAAWRVSGRK